MVISARQIVVVVLALAERVPSAFTTLWLGV
jgi:hypothetical protein